MKIAITKWNNRVSPVFDEARSLTVIDVEDGKERGRNDCFVPEHSVRGKVRSLVELGIDTVICGAVSREMSRAINQKGIQLIPWVSGEVEEVLSAYLADELSVAKYSMPGCKWSRGKTGTGKGAAGGRGRKVRGNRKGSGCGAGAGPGRGGRRRCVGDDDPSPEHEPAEEPRNKIDRGDKLGGNRAEGKDRGDIIPAKRSVNNENSG
ncbi:MAG: NifB/NifX family molybdenum-iron cluster-binding protein [Candidatus Krumholzibacteriota bacterium]|nr:NifB/NifX family molybdenum-iron cluster-binding protein [Candidatus Krumholzibacteriota bacterium]